MNIAKRSRKRLKQLIAIRHGEYSDITRKLNKEGREQMQTLAKQIRKLVKKGHKVEVFSSPSVRATQSAEIIAASLHATYATCDVLGSDEYDDGAEKMAALLSLRNGSDVVVAVTHFESPSGIVNAFASQHFGKTVECIESKKGDGLLLCMRTGTIRESLLT